MESFVYQLASYSYLITNSTTFPQTHTKDVMTNTFCSLTYLLSVDDKV